MYQPKVYRRQGGDATVVASGGKIVVQTGGQIVPNSETQAAHIADFATNVSLTTTAVGKLNALLAACEGVGILATS